MDYQQGQMYKMIMNCKVLTLMEFLVWEEDLEKKSL